VFGRKREKTVPKREEGRAHQCCLYKWSRRSKEINKKSNVGYKGVEREGGQERERERMKKMVQNCDGAQVFFTNWFGSEGVGKADRL